MEKKSLFAWRGLVRKTSLIDKWGHVLNLNYLALVSCADAGLANLIILVQINSLMTC